MSGEGGPLIRMVLLGLGVVLLDYSSQAAINPCEALMSDMMAEVQKSVSYPLHPPPLFMYLFSLNFLLLPVRFILLSLFCSLISLTSYLGYCFSLFSSHFLPLYCCFFSSQLNPHPHSVSIFAVFSASPC
jgi:hypothetical protein